MGYTKYKPRPYPKSSIDMEAQMAARGYEMNPDYDPLFGDPSDIWRKKPTQTTPAPTGSSALETVLVAVATSAILAAGTALWRVWRRRS